MKITGALIPNTTSTNIEKSLDSFDPIDQGWDVLGLILEKIKQCDSPVGMIPSLLRVFERWPGATTGGGWLYSSLHLIEEFDHGSSLVLKSLLHCPSILTVMLMERAIRGCTLQSERASLLMQLKKALRKKGVKKSVRREIEQVIESLETS